MPMKPDFPLKEIYTITLERTPDPDDVLIVRNGLADFNRRKCGLAASEELVLLLKNEQQKTMGGLIGFTYGEWFRVQTLWVEEGLKGAGYGSWLLLEAEIEAVKRGCRIADVQTFGFQAPEFYRKNGYEMFAELENAVGAQSIYFFRKKLS